MSTMSSRRHLLKGAASLGIAGVLGTYHAAVQSAQAAPLDVQRTPIQVTVNSAAFDISGFTLSYEVKGLKAVFDSGLYTPYFEIGSFNARKEFKVFYFIPMDSPRKGAEFIASKDLYRQTVNMPKDDTPGLKAKYSIRLTLRPVRDHYTILRELYVDLPVNIDDAWEPFITDVGSEDLYGSDIYATCRAKVLFLDRQHRFFPKRQVTRGDLMEALYRAAESPEAHLPLPGCVYPGCPVRRLYVGYPSGTNTRLVGW